MIFQNDPGQPGMVLHFGCYSMALFERLCTNFDLPFTQDRYLEMLNWGIETNVIDDEFCIIFSPQEICDHVVGKGRVRYWGKFTPTRWCDDREFEIQVWHRDGATFSHYVSGDGKVGVVYDSWYGGSKSVRFGRLVGKRIYRIAA
jgi:hypothetical protein